MDTFSLFPLHELDNPETIHLDPDRTERVHIPPDRRRNNCPLSGLKNFEMVFTGYDETQAVVEATRCIHCPATEPCIIGCPVIMTFPELYSPLNRASMMRRPAFSALHPTFPKFAPSLSSEVLCEGSCTVAGYDRAVNIGKLEAFSTDWQRNHTGFPLIVLPPATGRRVAVVGSGPASIAVAEQLARHGHAVVVYEEWPKPGDFFTMASPVSNWDKDIVAGQDRLSRINWREVHLQHARRTRY